VDVADAAAVDRAADAIESELGPLDVWVNVAFASVFAPFWQISAEEFERITLVSYVGFANGTRAAITRMRPRDHGTVVQVGSALAYRGIPLQSAYCGAKHAIQGMTESLRCELMHEGSQVRVTMVQLPALNTPQFDWVRSKLPNAPQPVPPIFQPELAARAVVHAAQHPDRREYWTGGSTALTLLANAVAPGLLERYLARTGIDSQQSERPGSNGAGNLFQPADDATDHGAHGRFDDRAAARSVQWWLTQRRRPLLAGLAGGGVLAAGLLRRR
jgi:short-subunit dehydrogenase